jgi:Na+/citrate or Na+/malate symporter
VGWTLCGAIMGIGLAVASERAAITAHAIGGPVIFALVAWSYFTGFGYTTALPTAAIFFLTALLLDVFVAGLLIQGSLDMFRSAWGTWIPLALSFAATYVVGRYVKRPQL